jgi:hypothetical protein
MFLLKYKKAIAQTMALSLMLVLLPLISWYYLSKGLDYQIEARSELGDHGKWSLIEYRDLYGNELNPDFFEGKMVIGGVYHANLSSTLEKLYHQFDERDDLLFVFLSNSKLVLPSDHWSGTDGDQIIWVNQEVSNGHNGPLNSDDLFFLTDVTGTVRKFYDLNDVQQVKRLVEQTAILLPKKQDRELVFKRDVEK